MSLLLLFAFVAGLVTVLSPCIIPVLPAILSAGAGKGKARPFGVVLGLIISFSFFTLSLTFLVQSFGISANLLHNTAIAILALFGLVMLFPTLSDKFAAYASLFAGLGNQVQQTGKTVHSGFLSGFILGLALGLVWTPCAGPILASVIALVASHGVNAFSVLMTLTYSFGAGIPMFLIAYGGNRALTTSRFFSKHSEEIRRGFGVLMILTALAIYFHADVAFQQLTLNYIPNISIENNPTVQAELQKWRGGGASSSTTQTTDSTLPILYTAPKLIAGGDWFNSKPLIGDDLKGKVVLIDFWTYSCINCLRTLPYLTRWYDTYKDKGFVIIGVHTPEFEFEKDSQNVAEAIKRLNVPYPVMQDNKYATWRNFNNSYWPAHFLIDRDGNVRSVHFGEGAYVETENAIRSLLNEAPLKMAEPPPAVKRLVTRETYLGYGRADTYASGQLLSNDQVMDYHKKILRADEVGLEGKWLVSKEKITSAGKDSVLMLNFLASQVYLVLSTDNAQAITVELDNKPLPSKYRTDDMNEKGQIVVKEARKYNIVDLKGDYGRHVLTLHIPNGVSAYAFTFGAE